MPRVVFMRGVPASGKSTVARGLVRDEGFVRVNMDDIRAMLGVEYSKQSENLALSIQDSAFLSALRAGQNVVVDNTHLHKAWPRRLALLAWESGIDVEYEIKHIDTPVDTALFRNQYRRESPQFEDSQAVPDDVIRKAAQKIQSKAASWTVDDITQDCIKVEPYVLDDDNNLPPAFLCDLDGTLADHAGHRSPYDTGQCEKDEYVDAVGDILYSAYADGNTIILMSGRSEEFREETERWLRTHRVRHSALHMRGADDKRRDSMVKLDLFNEHIRDKYDVTAVFDDRLRVCQIWHQLGLPLFRVGDPDADF